MSSRVGLQLYTVHVECEDNFRGVLKKAAELGYQSVEFTGYYGLTAEELKKELDTLGLKPVSSQKMIPDIAENLDEVVAYAKAIGLENIASCVGDVSSKEAMLDTIEQIRPLVHRMTEEGMYFLYHNHGPEFALIDGERPIDVLLRTFEGENFGLELDTYWAAEYGADICAFMKENADKIKNIHVKGGDGKGHSCPFERSVLDVREIVSCALSLGIPDILVEDDTPDPDGMTVAILNSKTLKEWKAF